MKDKHKTAADASAAVLRSSLRKQHQTVMQQSSNRHAKTLII
jgi:hypothetical protein